MGVGVLGSGQVFVMAITDKYGEARGQWKGMMGLPSALKGTTEDFFKKRT